MEKQTISMPMVALRGMAVHPEMVVHFDVSRSRSIESVQKAMQMSLFSEACCAASIWMGSVYTSYKVSINDISAVLDTANGIEIYSRILFITTILINIFSYWKIVKSK